MCDYYIIDKADREANILYKAVMTKNLKEMLKLIIIIFSARNLN